MKDTVIDALYEIAIGFLVLLILCIVTARFVVKYKQQTKIESDIIIQNIFTKFKTCHSIQHKLKLDSLDILEKDNCRGWKREKDQYVKIKYPGCEIIFWVSHESFWRENNPNIDFSIKVSCPPYY